MKRQVQLLTADKASCYWHLFISMIQSNNPMYFKQLKELLDKIWKWKDGTRSHLLYCINPFPINQEKVCLGEGDKRSILSLKINCQSRESQKQFPS